MPNIYSYNCYKCMKDFKTPDQSGVKCACGNSDLVYLGYEDENGNYYKYVPEDSYHYFHNRQDGGLYWFHDETKTWYPRGQQPVVEIEESFPESDLDREVCIGKLKGWGLKSKDQRSMAITMIQSQAVISKVEASKYLLLWNKAFPGSGISIQKIGPCLTASSGTDFKMEVGEDDGFENNTNNIPDPITITYNGRQHTLSLFSSIGGHHLIYSPSGLTLLVNGAQNCDVLVRMPFTSDAPHPSIGFKNGCAWTNDLGLKIPRIYNSKTLAQDGYYIVEKIPHGFNPEINIHFQQVKTFLTTMSEIGNGPDFRPDNVRFRNNGEMVLIDFSENPGVQQAQSDDFAALMKDFTRQFANCNKADTSLYEKLRAGMRIEFRQSMDIALSPWEK